MPAPPTAGSEPPLAGDAAEAAEEPAAAAAAAADLATLGQFFDHAPAAVYLKNAAGQYLMVNQEFLSIFALAREEVVGRFEEDVHPPEVAAAIRENDRELIERGTPVRFNETVRHHDGLRDYLSAKVPLREPGGRVWGLGGISIDVTERNRAVRNLTDLKLRTELILNAVGEGVYGLDLEGRVTFVNPAAADMIGWDVEALHGLHQHDVLHHTRPDGRPFPREECPIYAVLQDGEPRSVDDEVFWRKDGTSFPVAYESRPIRRGGRVTGAVVTFRDRTADRDRERIRRELQAARKVQQRLYPAECPEVAGFEFGAAVFPAEEACGDYYDFIPQGDGAMGVVVGDVSGHGLGPSLVMVEIRALLRAGLTAAASPADALNRLERLVGGDLHDDTFVTMLLGRLDPRARTFEYAAAGHVGWHLPAGGPPRRLESTGPPVGLCPEMPVEPGPTVPLAAGDLLLINTDGLEESMNADGDCFGWGRVLDAVEGCRDAPAAEIVNRLQTARRDFSLPEIQRDDVTLVVVRAL